MSSIKQILGCWLHERWRTELCLSRGQWRDLCNRNERLAAGSASDARACRREHSSWLTVARVFPAVGARLFRQCFEAWPLGAGPSSQTNRSLPDGSVSVVLPVSGGGRRLAFEAVLASFLSQEGIVPEVIVVEYGEHPEYAERLPAGVRYIHLSPQDGEQGFSRARTLNAGAALASGEYLVLHDADILVPRTYLKSIQERLKEGWEAIQPLRYLFYLGEQESEAFISSSGTVFPRCVPDVRQNFSGGSIAVTRKTYRAIGGHDEDFSGWGGEDSDFLDRISAKRLFHGGIAPAVHLWHPPQARGGSGDGNARLLSKKRLVNPEERILKLATRWRQQYEAPSVQSAHEASAVEESSMISAMVSVIIPVRNRPDLLRQAVQSVLDQTYRPVEVIIVDDASTDETPALIAELVQTHPDTIRTFKGAGRGPGPARETGRQQARGEFIQYLDSDDLLHPCKFEIQVDALNKNLSADIAYGITRLVDSGGAVLNDCLKWSGQSREFLYPGLLVDRWWSTHTPLWRKTLCDRIGSWSSLRYSEDWEYEARAGGLKARLVFVPQVVCDVRQHEGSRETRSGQWLPPVDQVRFFYTLYAGAVEAGVPAACPEMRHFVRWAFAAARYAARQHEAGVAAQLLSLAETAAGQPSRQLLMYRRLSKFMGWHTLAVVSEWLGRALRRRLHKDTLRQSWMDDDYPVRKKG